MPFLFIVLFFVSSYAFADDELKAVCDQGLTSYQAEWKACTVDSDCVQAVGACGFPATVNSAHLAEASCYFQNITKKQAKCMKMVQPAVTSVTCDEVLHTCVLTFNK